MYNVKLLSMNCTIVLRHADREEITSKKQAPFAKLTLKGRLKAIRHGLWLKVKYGHAKEIYSSKTARCVQTASIIVLPFSLNSRPKLSVDYDYYGFFSTGYIKDGKLDYWMEDILSQKSKITRYNEMFAKWAEMGLLKCTLQEYGRAFLSRYLINHNIIAVTHDSIIGPLMESLSHEYVFALRDYMIQPAPLAGFCIEHENKKIHNIRWLEFGKEPQLLW